MSTDSCPVIKTKVVPECDLKFKFGATYSGGTVVGGVITPATVAHHINLCCNTVTLNVPCPNETKRIILGIPLVYVDGCYVYSLKLPSIAGPTLYNNVYTSNIEVKTVVGDELLAIGLQVANGYLYVEIDVEGKLIVDEEECSASISLYFSVFDFELNRKMNCCHIKCKPVTWTYGDDANEVDVSPVLA